MVSNLEKLPEPDFRGVAGRLHLRELFNAHTSVLRAGLGVARTNSGALDLSQVLNMDSSSICSRPLHRFMVEAAKLSFSEIVMPPMASLTTCLQGPHARESGPIFAMMPSVTAVDFSACGTAHDDPQMLCQALEFLPNLIQLKLPTCFLSISQTCSLRSTLATLSPSLRSLTIAHLPPDEVHATRLCAAMHVCWGLTHLSLSNLATDASNKHLECVAELFDHVLGLTGLQSLSFPVVPQHHEDVEDGDPVPDLQRTLQPLSALTALTSLEVWYHKAACMNRMHAAAWLRTDLGRLLSVLSDATSPLERLKVFRLEFPWKQSRYDSTHVRCICLKACIAAPHFGPEQSHLFGLLGICMGILVRERYSQCYKV